MSLFDTLDGSRAKCLGNFYVTLEDFGKTSLTIVLSFITDSKWLNTSPWMETHQHYKGPHEGHYHLYQIQTDNSTINIINDYNSPGFRRVRHNGPNEEGLSVIFYTFLKKSINEKVYFLEIKCIFRLWLEESLASIRI